MVHKSMARAKQKTNKRRKVERLRDGFSSIPIICIHVKIGFRLQAIFKVPVAATDRSSGRTRFNIAVAVAAVAVATDRQRMILLCSVLVSFLPLPVVMEMLTS